MKRKASTAPKEDAAEDSRAQRKRVQNRISQKCHRERQAAHARHLESVVDVMKTGNQEGDSDRYTILLKQHMKIIEEKRELEEVIFRMRKKLLSISNSAAAAADDEAVDALISSKNRMRPRQSGPDSPSSPSPDKPLKPSNEECPVNVDSQVQNEVVLLPDVAVDQPPAIDDSQGPQLLNLVNSHDDILPEPSGSLLPQNPPINSNSNFVQPDAFFNLLADQKTPQDHAWSFGELELTFPFDYAFSIPSPTETLKTLSITSASFFTEAMLHACKKYLGHSQILALDDGTVFPHDFTASGWSTETPDTNSLSQVSEIAVQILAAFAGLEPYLYGVGAASLMESVLRWRLMPSFSRRIAVPEPFRPTPLQYSTSGYPQMIDFVNWPEIRDQLILQSRTINIDEIVREVVQNTVVEIPHRQISVSVLSLFNDSTFNSSDHLVWNDKLRTAITDAQWKYLEIPAPPEPDFVFQNIDSSPMESALMQEIACRMDACSNISSPEHLDTVITTPRGIADNLIGSWSEETVRKNDIVTRFGLDQFTKWKLSKEFARKHPFLDCSSAVTAYDMVSAQSALEAEATAC